MVLLTGATGFLGSFVLQELVAKGIEITGLCRNRSRIPKSYPRLNWVEADLNDLASLRKIPRPDRGIVHLASTLSLCPETVMNVDVLSMRELLKLWGDGSFVFCSSTDVYGRLQEVPTTEEHKLAPVTWYGLGKLICEEQLRLCGRLRKRSDFTIFRSPYILGAHPRFSSSFVGRLIAHARSGGDFILPRQEKARCLPAQSGFRHVSNPWKHRRKIPSLGNTSPNRKRRLYFPKYQENSGSGSSGTSWVNARDLARWMVAAIQGGSAGTYNAANSYSSWEDLLKTILNLTAGKGSVVLGNSPDNNWGFCEEERRFSTEKLSQNYDADNLVNLEESLREIINPSVIPVCPTRKSAPLKGVKDCKKTLKAGVCSE